MGNGNPETVEPNLRSHVLFKNSQGKKIFLPFFFIYFFFFLKFHFSSSLRSGFCLNNSEIDPVYLHSSAEDMMTIRKLLSQLQL